MFDAEKLARPCLRRITPYVPGKPLEEVKRELGLDDVIKMASNENPLGSSPLAVQAMVKELTSQANRYPESTAPELRAKLAGRLGVTPEQIVTDNGEDAVISLVALTFINPGDEAVMPDISFPSFGGSVLKMDGSPVQVPLDDGLSMDVEATIRAITPRTKLVFLCNPNNPTGLTTSRTEFEQLLNAVPRSALLVSDEAYLDFVDDPDYPKSLGYLADHPNLLILRTFSKVYGLAGLRVGYGIGHPNVIAMMNQARNVFPVNRIAQAGAMAAMDDHGFHQLAVETNRQGRLQLYGALDQMGLTYWPSQANFVLLDVGKSSAAVGDGLMRLGVIVRPQRHPRLAETVRISVGTAAENQRAIAALKQVLAQG